MGMLSSRWWPWSWTGGKLKPRRQKKGSRSLELNPDLQNLNLEFWCQKHQNITWWSHGVMHHVCIGAADVFQLKALLPTRKLASSSWRPFSNKQTNTLATALDIAGLDAAALSRHSWLQLAI